MRFLLLLFLLSLYVLLTTGRPSQQNEDDGQTGAAEYEAGASAEEYVQEDRDPIKDDHQRSYDDPDDSQNEEENENAYSEPNAENPQIKNDQQFLDDQKMNDGHILRGNRNDKDANEDSLPDKKKSNIYKRTFHKDKYTLKEDDNLNVASHTNEDAGDLLLKNYRDQGKKDINNYRTDNEGTKQRSIFNINKESYTQMQGNLNEKFDKKLDNTYLYDRARRDIGITNAEERNNKKNMSDNKEMGDIIDINDSVNNKDGKELTRQDLEDLLNSLSVDKINIIKKIINDNENIYKRDITKKAGAVNEESYSENGRFDIKQMQGEYRSPDPIETSMSENVASTESPKPTDSNSPKSSDIDISTAIQKSSNNAQLSETDADQDSSLTEVKNKEQLDGITELKNENNQDEGDMDLENVSNLEASCDISKHHNLNNYKETVESNHGQADDYSEFQKFNNKVLKRDISKKEEPDVCSSIQSLEESFPNFKSNRNTNINSDLEPLVRVKRTDKQNNLKDDITYASLKVPFNSEDDYLAADDQGETKDYECIGEAKQLSGNNNLLNHDKSIAECSRQKRQPNVNQNNEVKKKGNINFETDNLNVGSDKSLSNVGIDETLMYNGKARNKRTEGNTITSDSFDTCDTNLGYNKQIIDKGEESANNENGSHDTEADNFGTFLGRKDVNRYKRIRQVNGAVQIVGPNNN